MGQFVTTQWSLIRRAAGSDDQARQALTSLVQRYQDPISAYFARYRVPGMDTSDLVQEFLTQLMESGLLASANARAGSFRAYVITSMRHFIARRLEHANALKRGGDVIVGPLDESSACADEPMPEDAFDQAWARAVLTNALRVLESEATTAGRQEMFKALAPFLTEPAARSDYVHLGEMLGRRPNTIAVAVHRLRERYRALVRAEVLHTVANAADLETELDCLRELV